MINFLQAGEFFIRTYTVLKSLCKGHALMLNDNLTMDAFYSLLLELSMVWQWTHLVKKLVRFLLPPLYGKLCLRLIAVLDIAFLGKQDVIM